MGKIIVQTLRKIGKLNVIKLNFKKYSVVKLATTHIFFYLQFVYPIINIRAKNYNQKIFHRPKSLFL